MHNKKNEISNQGSQEKHGRCYEDAIRKEVAHQLRESIDAVRKELERQQIIFTHHQQEDVEKSFIFNYAKANNLWIEDFYSLGTPTNAGGYENTLALNETNGFIYKSNNLFNAKFLISNLLEQIRLHNELFPETGYEIVGFTGFKNGANSTPYIEAIL